MISKFLIFCLFVQLVLSEQNEDTKILTEWIEYEKGLVEHIVQNDSKEIRLQIFTQNMERIKQHNLRPRLKKSDQDPTYLMGPNHLAHLTNEEIDKIYLVQINFTDIQYQARLLNENNNKTCKDLFLNCNTSNKSEQTSNKRTLKFDEVSVDWAARGYLSPTTDQGACGSCYAFSTAWAVESAYAIKHNVRLNVNQFSKQQLVDCTYYTEKDDNNKVYNNVGCMGGNIYRTLEYIYYNGLELEADYPYVSMSMSMTKLMGKVQDCKYDKNKFKLKIKNYYGINYRDIEEMKKVVSQQPVIAYFLVTSEFYYYKSGIFTTTKCGPANDSCGRVNHSVLIVGYGREKGIDYWLCKNSWGPNWGENGYFKIEMNSNMCCVEGFSMYPYL